MQDRFGENLTEFIRHFLMKNGAVIQTGRDILFALKEGRADGESPQQIVEYLQEITRFAEYYARLLTPSLEPSASVSHQMHRLKSDQKLQLLTHSCSTFTTTMTPVNFRKISSQRFCAFWKTLWFAGLSAAYPPTA